MLSMSSMNFNSLFLELSALTYQSRIIPSPSHSSYQALSLPTLKISPTSPIIVSPYCRRKKSPSFFLSPSDKNRKKSIRSGRLVSLLLPLLLLTGTAVRTKLGDTRCAKCQIADEVITCVASSIIIVTRLSCECNSDFCHATA